VTLELEHMNLYILSNKSLSLSSSTRQTMHTSFLRVKRNQLKSYWSIDWFIFSSRVKTFNEHGNWSLRKEKPRLVKLHEFGNNHSEPRWGLVHFLMLSGSRVKGLLLFPELGQFPWPYIHHCRHYLKISSKH